MWLQSNVWPCFSCLGHALTMLNCRSDSLVDPPFRTFQTSIEAIILHSWSWSFNCLEVGNRLGILRAHRTHILLERLSHFICSCDRQFKISTSVSFSINSINHRHSFRLIFFHFQLFFKQSWGGSNLSWRIVRFWRLGLDLCYYLCNGGILGWIYVMLQLKLLRD